VASFRVWFSTIYANPHISFNVPVSDEKRWLIGSFFSNQDDR
jgi:hypothetical protein